MLSLMLRTTANAIAAEVAASGFGSGGLDEANDLVVSGGDVTAAEAADIQAISATMIVRVIMISPTQQQLLSLRQTVYWIRWCGYGKRNRRTG